jgi:hypothetical protein
LTSLSVEPVARKPGITGFTSKADTASSCACSCHVGAAPAVRTS